MRPSTVYLADLEALRGVAIALVFAYHYDACILGVEPGAWVSPAYAFVSATNAWLQWLGVLSYSIYMVHYPLVDLSLKFMRGEEGLAYLSWNRRTALAGVVLAAACVALSTLTYRSIELPFLRRKAKLDG